MRACLLQSLQRLEVNEVVIRKMTLRFDDETNKWLEVQSKKKGVAVNDFILSLINTCKAEMTNAAQAED